jgi:hypothetical protein
MTAYMKWRGLTETVLSLYRGAGALAGIASTVVFPRLHADFGELLSSLSAIFFHSKGGDADLLQSSTGAGCMSWASQGGDGAATCNGTMQGWRRRAAWVFSASWHARR